MVLADGTVIEGFGAGATGEAEGEVCFNTAMTGYQEILTDPSYARQIITFTFPHIGNVGANPQDDETASPIDGPCARGCVFRNAITTPSSYRSRQHLDEWLKLRGIIAIHGVDTRALTARIRASGMPNAIIAHHGDGRFEFKRLKAQASAWSGLKGADLVPEVTCAQPYPWAQTTWAWPQGFGRLSRPLYHVVAMDYGLKRNILRCLAALGCKVTVVTATANARDILALRPDGVVLSNGPGDPAATGRYAVPQIKSLIASGKPIFGICLGHQILGLALGARTMKMHQGHHGANHPVRDRTTGKVEIACMNHGFVLDRDSLPATVEETHISLFDGSNCGIALKGRPVFSVQYHPEASPGPQDSHYLFRRFADLMATSAGTSAGSGTMSASGA
ncbi:MAG: glutamine-hydrolyzing carbamoyl-phosphate synthase small subunit [Hyphomicrobiales bacterium]